MRLKEKHVLEFQRLYKKVYKINLSRDEAYSQCMDMMILGQIIYSPFTKDELKALEKLKKY